MKKSKDRRIADERDKLLSVFETVGENKLTIVMSLIDRAAYITVNLQDLEQELNETGWTENYQNGEHQTGKKKSAAADVYISLTKNLNAIIKQLVDLCPAEQRAESKLMAMMSR